jgi:hypothetical protein
LQIDKQPAICNLQSAIPKITDFGLAKRLDHEQGHTQTGSILGTPSYMAPEQAGGKTKEVGPAADIYALGAILYELLTGRPPFCAVTPLDTLLLVVSEEPVPPSRLAPKTPPDLETICLKCLEKEPRRRYATPLELAEDQAAFLADRPIGARPVGSVERAWRWCKRNRTLAAAIILVVAALLAGSIVSSVFGFRAQASAEQSQLSAEEAHKAQQAAELARTEKERQRQAAQDLAQANQRQVVNLMVANGNRLLREGDPGGALPWFAEAERLDPKDPFHRTRLDGALRALPRIVPLERHNEGISDIAVSADGRFAVTGSLDTTARLWDLETGKPMGKVLQQAGPVLAVAISPDGKQIATGGGAFGLNGEVHIWESSTGRDLRLALHTTGAVVFVGFTADGTRLVTCEFDLPTSVLRMLAGQTTEQFVFRIWDLRSGKHLGKIATKPRGTNPEADEVARLVHAASGRVLVVEDKSAHVVDLASGKVVGSPWKHEASIWFARFSHDGTRAITATRTDGHAEVRDLASGKDTTLPLAYGWKPLDAAFQEGGEVAGAFYDGAVNRYQFERKGRVLLTVAQRAVYLWDAITGELLRSPVQHGSNVLVAGHSPVRPLTTDRMVQG